MEFLARISSIALFPATKFLQAFNANSQLNHLGFNFNLLIHLNHTENFSYGSSFSLVSRKSLSNSGVPKQGIFSNLKRANSITNSGKEIIFWEWKCSLLSF